MRRFFLFLFLSFFFPLLSHLQKLEFPPLTSAFEEDLRLYNEQRSKRIIEVIEECQNECSLPYLSSHFTLFVIGSTANGFALPSSDLEFGILIDGNNLRCEESCLEFLTLFHKKCENVCILFDKKGWVPSYYFEGRKCGSQDLLGTPEKMIYTLQSSKNSTLRYTLNMTKFLYGDPLLFNIFKEGQRKNFPYQTRLFSREFYLTCDKLKNISSIQEHVRFLLGKKKKKHTFASLHFKPHLTNPLSEFVHYLAFHFQIPMGNSFEELKALNEKGALEIDFAEDIRKALVFGMQKRLLFEDKDVPFGSLSHEDLMELEIHYETLFTLSEFTRRFLR